MSAPLTQGVLYVHSTPAALCSHIEWAVSGQLGDAEVSMSWTPQRVAPGTLRSDIRWRAVPGTGARLASALRGWAGLLYEVTEDASLGVDGARWTHTPDLGIHHTMMDSCGNNVVGEDRIRAAILASDSAGDLKERMDELLGAAWDEELEPYRQTDPASYRWLHRVG